MEQLLQRVSVVEQRLSDQDRRIANVEMMQAQLVELNRQNAEMLVNMRTLQCDVGEIKHSVGALDDKVRVHELEPAEKWNKVVWLVLTMLITAALTLVITRIGLGG